MISSDNDSVRCILEATNSLSTLINTIKEETAMIENFEKYIKDLSPELQEKARECKTKEELNAFIAENEIELPDEALELVSGGCGTSTPPDNDDNTISINVNGNDPNIVVNNANADIIGDNNGLQTF